MQHKRSTQVAETIKRMASDIIANDLNDPRIGFVTVTGVELADDLRYAKIFVSIFEPEPRQKECLQGLNSAKGFIRREIGHRLSLRYTPDIDFKVDTSIAEGDKIDRLLNQLNREHSDDAAE